MVALAQLVELWIVIPKVTGSIPVRHPSFPYVPVAQLDAQRLPNPKVAGSTPAWDANQCEIARAVQGRGLQNRRAPVRIWHLTLDFLSP